MKLYTEYEVETIDGELINCFKWRELVQFFEGVNKETIKASARRGTLLLGQYRVNKVKYSMEENY